MGTVILSIDAELVGSGNLLPDPPGQEVQRRRHMWKEMLKRLDEHEIPATWAIVGRLFSDESGPLITVNDLTTDARNQISDPQSYVSRHRRFNEEYSAPRLIDAIRKSSVNHEIGAHSFSHIRYTYLRSAAARRDIEACRSATRSTEDSLSSFVFPTNSVGHTDIIEYYGYNAIRGRASATPGDDAVSGLQELPTILKHIPESVKKNVGEYIDHLATAYEYSVDSSPPELEPITTEGTFTNLPGSIWLFRLPGQLRAFFRKFGVRPTLRRAKQGVDAAVEQDRVFHAWLHPHDLRDEGDLKSFSLILRYLFEMRNKADLDVVTMDDAAERGVDS